MTVPNNGNANNGGNNQNTNPGQTSASSGLKLMNASNAAKTDFYMLDGTVASCIISNNTATASNIRGCGIYMEADMRAFK